MGLYGLQAHVRLQILGRNLMRWRTKMETGLWRWKSSATGGHHMSKQKCACEWSGDRSTVMSNFL